MTGFVVSKIIQSLILPPGGPLLLCLAAVLLWRRWPRLGRAMLAVGLVALYIASAPVVSHLIGRPLYQYEAVADPAGLGGAGAIVVLGAGIHPVAPEYGGRDTIGGQALDRVRYGAYLHRRSGVPLLVTGGTIRSVTSEAEAMRAVLEDEFSVPVRWVEDRAFNTRENASYARELLSTEGVDHIALVTNAYHMRRAVRDFERVGFTVTPAPTMLPAPWRVSVRSFLPSAGAMRSTHNHLHEWLGIAWSHLTGGD